MHEVVLPALGQSVEEASIVTWLKSEGDAVKEGEPICTIQTDKAEIECESTASGVLRKILVAPDVFVPILTPIALVGAKDEAIPEGVSAPSAPSAESAPAPAAAAAPAPKPEPAAVSTPAATDAPARIDAPVSPRARAAARDLHVDPAVIAGSGVGGRVMEADVRAYAGAAPKATSTAKRLAEQNGVDLRALQGTGAGGRITKEDVLGQAGQAPAAARPAAASPAPSGAGTVTPLSPMRKIIAERMSASKFTAPHYYVSIEADMLDAVSFRNAQTAFKPSFNDLVLRAVVRAIQKVPAVNARWLGDAIEVLEDINLGVAVALPTGLVVPVIRQAQRKSLQDIARESRELVDKAKNNKLLPDDYQGNSFTVSNMGVYGIDHFTAIINQPDSAILAVGAIKDQVVAINGGICIRPRMMMTLSSDHRVIDGAVAAQFMAALKETLEAADF